MQPIHAPAGQRTVLKKIRQGSIPMEFDYAIEPATPGTPLEGLMEVTASQWILPQAPKQFPLETRHRIKRGMWNTFFTITIIPDVDVVVTQPEDSSGGGKPSMFLWLILAIAVLIVVAAAGMMLMSQPPSS